MIRTILNEGRNCWQTPKSGRVSYLIDAADYFESVLSAMNQARKTIYIAAWDIDSRTNLRPNHTDPEQSVLFGHFLNEKVASTPGLQVYILCWDFSMIYLLEREWLPLFNLSWKTHSRLHFHLTGEHPTGASHHQKFVVVDDCLAFCGGIDLTQNRWDTSEHRIDDPRRVDPDGKPYEPFHDVQMVVDSDAAAALGEMFRGRWQFETGEKLHPVQFDGNAHWPEGTSVDLNDVPVAIARTYPAYKDRNEIREVETLFRDAIEAAEKYIYIENQYLSSASIKESLSKCLHEKVGPEIVIVLPRRSSGWLERNFMDALRIRVLEDLFRADEYDRLRVVYPALTRRDDLYVHAKVFVVDDHFARVGSANLNNRSMGLDSECDLAIEAGGKDSIEKGISFFRNRLLAEHLESTPGNVEKVLRETKSLIRTIEALSGNGRSLKRVDNDQEIPIDVSAILTDTSLADPEKPIQLDQMIDQFVNEEADGSRNHPLTKFLVVIIVLIGLSVLWRWSSLSEWLTVQRLADWALLIEGSPLTLPLVVGVYILGSLVMLPVTLLVGATAMVFPPVTGAAYALIGCVSSAWVTYALGARLGKGMVRRLAGKSLNRLSRLLAKQGFLVISLVRNLPIAPFTIVNMVAGASHIKLRDYLLGTAVGMLPGILAIALFVDRFLAALRNPSAWNVAIALTVIIGIGLGARWVSRRVTRL